eukprot:763937-Hanusia_phi.AAC.9
MLFWIISRGQLASHPLDVTWYSLQIVAEVSSTPAVCLAVTRVQVCCILVALWVLWEVRREMQVGRGADVWGQISSESSKKKDKGESESLLGK